MGVLLHNPAPKGIYQVLFKYNILQDIIGHIFLSIHQTAKLVTDSQSLLDVHEDSDLAIHVALVSQTSAVNLSHWSGSKDSTKFWQMGLCLMSQTTSRKQ